MNFSDWIFLTEIVDVQNLSTDDMKLSSVKFGYEIEFEHDDQLFKILFREVDITFRGEDVPDSYSISFKGPNDYDLTGKAGNSAGVIYAKVLLGIKKFLAIQSVNGLNFEGNDITMNPIYHRFYKQHLQKDFLRITETQYVKKSFLREFLGKISKSAQGIAYKSIIKNNRNYLDELQRAREIKKERRDRGVVMQKFLGQFIWSHNGTKLNYVYNITPNKKFEVLQLAKGSTHVFPVQLSLIDIPKFQEFMANQSELPQVGPQDIQNFLVQAKQSPFAEYFGLEQWYHRFNV
jgi:hypothetical protein